MNTSQLQQYVDSLNTDLSKLEQILAGMQQSDQVNQASVTASISAIQNNLTQLSNDLSAELSIVETNLNTLAQFNDNRWMVAFENSNVAQVPTSGATGLFPLPENRIYSGGATPTAVNTAANVTISNRQLYVPKDGYYKITFKINGWVNGGTGLIELSFNNTLNRTAITAINNGGGSVTQSILGVFYLYAGVPNSINYQYTYNGNLVTYLSVWTNYYNLIIEPAPDLY